MSEYTDPIENISRKVPPSARCRTGKSAPEWLFTPRIWVMKKSAFADAISCGEKDVQQYPVCGNLTDSDICPCPGRIARPFGLYVSLRMRADVTGLERVRRNIQGYIGVLRAEPYSRYSVCPSRGRGPGRIPPWASAALIDRLKKWRRSRASNLLQLTHLLKVETAEQSICKSLLGPLGVKRPPLPTEFLSVAIWKVSLTRGSNLTGTRGSPWDYQWFNSYKITLTVDWYPTAVVWLHPRNNITGVSGV